MKPAAWFPALPASPSFFLIIFAAVFGVGITTGCGSSGTVSPKYSGNTSVTVLLSSTANDQVSNFDLSIQSLSLTDQAGNVIPLLTASSPAEFVHLNGNTEPLTTVNIPQGVYSSAKITLGEAVFVCIAQDPDGGLLISHYSVVNQGPVVNVPSPITITGSNMLLSLNLLVADSAILPSCYGQPIFAGYSMSPTFSLTPLAASSSSANVGNTMATGLEASISAVEMGGSRLTLTVPAFSFSTRTLLASANGATVFQGVGGLSGLTAGMFVNMDGSLQSDGSLLATRIEVENPTALNISTGPVMSVDSIVPLIMQYGRTQMGPLLTDFVNGQPGQYDEIPYFNFSTATFQVSGQFTNLQSLPFVPSFTASNMLSGQNVDVTSGTLTLGGSVYTSASTITLIPQTVDGTVESISISGNVTVYTIALAGYDLFPQLAVQQGQITVLNDPGHVQVYVDGNTQKLATQSLAVGSTLRFYGLVFNDNGTLRMDCGKISDGVPFSSQSSAALTLGGIAPHLIQRAAPSGMQSTVSATSAQR